jgi:hypothetical protein
VGDAPRGKLPALEVALVGTLIMASAICVKMWMIMADIRQALTDPMTMAVLITEDSIKADNKKAEGMLEGARTGFADTERVVVVFSVALILIAVALVARVLKRGSSPPHAGGRGNGGRTPASR